MPYTVVIQETQVVRKMVDGQWAVLSEVDGKKDYGYAPATERNVSSERRIYEQTVADLDLAAVIKAINKL